MRKKLIQHDKPAVRTSPKKEVKKKEPPVKPVTESKPVTTDWVGLHNLKTPKGAHKRRKHLGRGSSSGHGKTSTRGSKGQTSRSGRATYPGFEGGQMPLIRRIPKRGFTSLFKKEYQIINVGDLQRITESTISPEVLRDKGLIRDKEKLVKILGDGEIKNPVTISVHAASKSAVEKIKSAGGKVEILHAS